MLLTAFEYSVGAEGNGWGVERLTLGPFNLIVGKNSAGKTRVLDSIRALADAIRLGVAISGQARAEFRDNSGAQVVFQQLSTDPRLKDWAIRLCHFPFSVNSSMGRGGMCGSFAGHSLLEALRSAISLHGPGFITTLLRDFRQAGHDLSAIDLNRDQDVWVLPDRLGKAIPVRSLSQGTFRSIALITWLNLLAAQQVSVTVLVDDLAEGLDYQHAARLADLLKEKAASFPFQFLVTTNDRYVMNRIPLEHWTVLIQDRSVIRAVNYANSRERFDQFKFTGLSNFDFFSMDFSDESQ